MRIFFAVGLFLASHPAPSGQGRACDAQAKCAAPLTCVDHAPQKSRCEVACKTSDDCPTSQMCIKDGPARVCRAQGDADGL